MDVMAIGARDAAISLLNRHVPGDLAIVGQEGITMGSWEWNDLTSLALDHVAFIDAIVQLIERRETRDGAAPNHCSQMHGSVGFNRLHTGKSGRRRFASDISFENAGLSLAVRD
jgi:DNA-binding LacI/PurR family transcriptional regulator